MTRAVRYSLPFLVAVLVAVLGLLAAYQIGAARGDSPEPSLLDAGPPLAALDIIPADVPDLPDPATIEPPVLDSGGLADDLPRWWRSGALAGPIALAVYGLLAAGRLLSRTRWPGLGWLRRGKVQGWISFASGAMTGTIIPLAVAGTLTGPGLLSAVAAISFALPAGGGTKAPDRPPSQKLPVARVVRVEGVVRLVDEATGDVLAEAVEPCEA